MPNSIRRQLRLVLVLLLLSCCAAVAEPIDKIKPSGYVTDLAGVLSQANVQKLEALCTEVDAKTGAQIAVVTVRSLDGRTVEDYAVDLFKHLGVGRKDNRGVLLLVAPSEHKYRFEVGYGLEPVINDARAGDIGREMVPYFRSNNYDAAIYLGTRRAADLIAADRNVRLTGAPPPQAHRSDPDFSFPWWAIPVGIFLIFRFLTFIGRGGRRRRRGSWWIGPMGGFGGGWGGGGFGGGGWGGGGGGFGGSSGGFGGFGGGSSGGGGASGSW